jgi:glutamine synthetase
MLPRLPRPALFANPDELLRYVSSEGVKFIDVRFCDLLGVMQHFAIPVESFDESTITNGVAFDGSSIRGFQEIHESDMLLLFRLRPTPHEFEMYFSI